MDLNPIHMYQLPFTESILGRPNDTILGFTYHFLFFPFNIASRRELKKERGKKVGTEKAEKGKKKGSLLFFNLHLIFRANVYTNFRLPPPSKIFLFLKL